MEELKGLLAAFEKEQAAQPRPARVEAPITLDQPMNPPLAKDDAYVYGSI